MNREELSTYIIPWDKRGQLLYHHRLVLNALSAQEHLTGDALLRVGGRGKAARYSVVKMFHVLSWDGFVVVTILKTGQINKNNSMKRKKTFCGCGKNKYK